MEAFVEGTVPLPGKHGWHADSSITVVPHTIEDLDGLIRILGLGCACLVSSVNPTIWPRLAGPCGSTMCKVMASPARLAYISLTQFGTLAGISLPRIRSIPSTKLMPATHIGCMPFGAFCKAMLPLGTRGHQLGTFQRMRASLLVPVPFFNPQEGACSFAAP